MADEFRPGSAGWVVERGIARLQPESNLLEKSREQGDVIAYALE